MCAPQRLGGHPCKVLRCLPFRLGNPLALTSSVGLGRDILLFLQSEAVKTRSRDIELGRCMRVWLGTMGLSIGGTTYRMANERGAAGLSMVRLR